MTKEEAQAIREQLSNGQPFVLVPRAVLIRVLEFFDGQAWDLDEIILTDEVKNG